MYETFPLQLVFWRDAKHVGFHLCLELSFGCEACVIITKTGNCNSKW